jgi:hypothetical protein
MTAARVAIVACMLACASSLYAPRIHGVDPGLRGQQRSTRLVRAHARRAPARRCATKRDCRLSTALEVECQVDYQPAIVLPNAGERAEF